MDVEVRVMSLGLRDEPDADGERHRRAEVRRGDTTTELLVAVDDLPRGVDLGSERR
jgi:hypothetical protein